MTQPAQPDDASPGTGSDPRVLTSADLLRGAREVVILHAGEAYRLRLTSRDRLILTK